MLRLLCALSMLVLTAVPVWAEEVVVAEDLILELPLQEDWSLEAEAPEALIEEIAEHVAHEAEEKGAEPIPEQIRRVAEKRLAANEAFVYHTATGAHIDIDFSALRADEEPPPAKMLKTSAEYAAQSLEGEEGVSEVRSEVVGFTLAGSEHAYRLDADYKHHEEPVAFIGIIGYAAGHWFYLYCTVPGRDAQALADIEAMLAGAELLPRTP